MDLVAGMLLDRLPFAEPLFQATRVQPPMRLRLPSLNANRLLGRLWDYPRHAGRLTGFDLFHVMDHSYAQLVHRLPADRTLVTCHDTDTFRCLFEPASEPRPLWFRCMSRHILRGLQKAAMVICVSESTRRQLVKHRLVEDRKTAVVHNGIHPEFLKPADEEARAGQTELLHVGSTIPRKRIDILFRVFAECRRVQPNLRLVHAGAAFTAAQLLDARSLGIDDAIDCRSSLDARSLAAAYRRAALTLIPSEAEGFGLPLAESMACATPVVASDIPALREVGGDAATYCAVGDVAGWTRRVLELLRERGGQADTYNESWSRRAAVCRGRAALFSWDRNAREIAALYRTILFGDKSSAWVGKLSSPAAPDSSDAMRPAAISGRDITLS